MVRVFLPTCAVVALCALAVLGPVRAGGGTPLAQADKSLAGQFLVATEALRDPRFARTVIYMVRHDASGALGLVVNRPVRDVPLAPLLRQFGLDDRGVNGSIRFHYGGPVEPASGFLLHTAEYATAGTERVAGDIAVTVLSPRPEVLGEIARGGGPRRFLFVLGYAGWGPGQLDGELEEGSWIVEPARPEDVFTDDPEGLWSDVLRRKGGPFAVLAAMPPDPGLN
jgi:putative transcriptional regulator